MLKKLSAYALLVLLPFSAYAQTKKTEAIVPYAATAALATQEGKAATQSLQPIVIIQKAEGEPALLWWQVLLTELIKLISLIVGIVVTGLIGVLAKKYNFQAQQTKIDFIATQAVEYVEQLSLRGLKLDNKPLESVDKLKTAIATAKELSKDLKLKQKSEAFWESTLESWVRKKKEGQTTTEVVAAS